MAEPYTPLLARVGDVIRTVDGEDTALLLGRYQSKPGWPWSWRAHFTPRHPDLGEPFESHYPYDFADRDIAAPGGLLCAADAWSSWTESAP